MAKSDDYGIDKLELWVDGVYTSVYDDTEPYELDWNTTVYEDGSAHVIVVRAYDINGNTSDTPAYTLTVDNSNSYPSAVTLYPIEYYNGSFLVTWSPNDDNDFSSYSLLEGTSDDINSMDTIYTTNMINDTTFTVLDIPEGYIRYYQVVVRDIYGYETGSNAEEGLSAVIWSNVYDYMDNSDWGNSIIEVDDGYWVTGVSNEQMRLTEIDLLGNIISNQIVSGGYANEIIDSGNDLFLIGGLGSWNYSAMKIFKLDYDGNILSNTYIQSDYGSGWAYGGIMAHSDDLIIVYGEMDGVAAVYALNQNFTIQDLVYVDHEMHRVKDMVKLENGYLIASSNNEQTKIVQTDLNFNFQNGTTLNGYCRSINYTDDGNVLTSLQTGENEHTLIKFNLSTFLFHLGK